MKQSREDESTEGLNQMVGKLVAAFNNNKKPNALVSLFDCFVYFLFYQTNIEIS